MRVALGIEYDGSRFHGFESQRDTRTVQGALEKALSRVADESVRTVCAGRTDAGVHALAQVVHMDTSALRSERSWVFGANSNLPADISVLWARPVDAAFHARFSAIGRRYTYVILNRASRPASNAGRVSWECRPLRTDAMQTAAESLLGWHDFSAFRASGCQARNPVRDLRRLDVQRHGDYVVLAVQANAFLQHMVRNLAGVLIAIGSGNRPVAWAAEVLASRDRRAGGVTASPHGLYFTGVDYPPHFRIPDLSPRIALW
jgi:tRNA pseudouridine38-40 synthase